MTKLRTAAFLARKPGLEILNVLLHHPRVDLCRVFTHRYLPKAEWRATRDTDALHADQTRPEFPVYEQWTRSHGIPLEDEFRGYGLGSASPTGGTLGHIPGQPFDLLLSCNWRHIVLDRTLKQFTRAINIHRGDLPKYPGVRPIRQAIEAGEKQVAITAHHMTAEIDGGDPVTKVYAPVVAGFDLDDAETKTRDSLEPLYAPLTRMILEMIK